MELEKYINSSNPYKPLLPIVHVCSAYRFKKMVERQCMLPFASEPYPDEELIYMFYGKPAYRPDKQGKSASPDSPAHPVALVFSPSDSISIKRIYPFDTGAYNMYREIIHPDIDRDAYMLYPDLQQAAKVVSAFYRDNHDYIYCRPKQDCSIPKTMYEVLSYYDLIRYNQRHIIDERKSSIEVQISESIPFAESGLMLVVAPDSFASDTDVVEKLDKWSVDLQVYRTSYGSPNEWIPSIRERVTVYLEEKSRI